MLGKEDFTLASLEVLLTVEKERIDIGVDNGQSMSRVFITEFCCMDYYVGQWKE